MLLTHTVTIQRMTMDAGVNKTRTWVDYLTFVECHIQPLDEQTATLADTRPFKSHLGVFPIEVDIKEGDRVLWGSTKFAVSALEKHTFGSIAHYEAILELAKE